MLEPRIDDLERTRKRDAQAAADFREYAFGVVAVDESERRALLEPVQDRLQFDRLVHFLENRDAFLQASGGRHVPRFYDQIPAPPRVGFAAPQKRVNPLIEELLVALEVGLTQFEFRRDAKQALKPRDRRWLRRRHLVGREPSDHQRSSLAVRGPQCDARWRPVP